MASIEFTKLDDISSQDTTSTDDLVTPPVHVLSKSALEAMFKSETETNSPHEITSFLRSDLSLVDSRYSDGMTPLMHTSYHGNLSLTRILIEHGASVNLMSRPAYYTPLMFAAIGNKVEVCRFLLSSGAKTGLTNSIDKNAAEMASFVGSKESARLISSFFSRDSFQYIASRFELPELVCSGLYSLLLEVNNIHPVHSLIAIKNCSALWENSSLIISTLEAITESSFKDTHEEISFRTHFIMRIFTAIQELEVSVEEFDSRCDQLIKKFLRLSSSDGRSSISMQVGMENHLRQAIRSFPFRDMPLYKQTLACLLAIEKDDKLKSQLASPALHVINSVIRGPLAAKNSMDPMCATCGEQGDTLKECTSCHSVWYCGKQCQKLHWFSHKKACLSLSTPSSQSEQ